jgi:hypothetical protein
MMFWKKRIGDDYEFVAVTRLTRVDRDKELFGKRHYELTLADGTKERATFEMADWQLWEASVSKGGVVINP